MQKHNWRTSCGSRGSASYACHRAGVIASLQADASVLKCNADAEGVISADAALALVAKR